MHRGAETKQCLTDVGSHTNTQFTRLLSPVYSWLTLANSPRVVTPAGWASAKSNKRRENSTCIFHFSCGTRLSTLLWARVPQEYEEYVLQRALGCSWVTVSFPATEELVMSSSVSRETFKTKPEFQYIILQIEWICCCKPNCRCTDFI